MEREQRLEKETLVSEFNKLYQEIIDEAVTSPNFDNVKELFKGLVAAAMQQRKASGEYLFVLSGLARNANLLKQVVSVGVMEKFINTARSLQKISNKEEFDKIESSLNQIEEEVTSG